MKRIGLIVLSLAFCITAFSQETENILVAKIQMIKQQQGDSIARDYLVSQKDSLEQKGESASYVLLWGLLTSNMWNSYPSEALRKEYREYLDAVFDDEIKSEDYEPNYELLSSLWQFTHDYYNMIYKEGDKETTLLLLTNMHRWFKPYSDARKTIGYAQSLLDLCLVLVRDMHRYREGEPYCMEYVDVAKAVYGEDSPQYAIALYNATVLPQTDSEIKKAFLEKAVSTYETANEPDEAMLQQMRQSYNMLIATTTGVASTIDVDDATILSIEDCSTLVITGQGEKALNSLKQYKKQFQNEEYLDTLKYSSVITLLINAYMQLGQYTYAQKEIDIFNKTIGISLDVLPADYVQIFFSSAGLIAYHLKDYDKALRYSQAACNLFEKTGNYGIEYCKVLANIAMIYAESGQYLDANFYLDAKWHIDEATSIFEERIGPLREHGSIGITLLSNKAIVYDAIGDREDAINVLEDIVNNFSDKIAVKDAWALAVNNLASMYMKQERWADGANLLERLNVENNDNNYLFSQNLALCRMYMKDSNKTVETIKRMNNYSINSIANIFSYFTGVEREDYWSQISKELILINNLAAYHTNNGEAMSIAYDNALFCKNLLLNSSSIIDRFISETSDKELLDTYYQYKNIKEKLAFKTDNQTLRDSLSREITKKERFLLESIQGFGQLLKDKTKTWKDVQNVLDNDEIAIEYCYAPRMDKYPDLKPYYGAFVLRKDFEHPILVSLDNVDLIEELFDSDNADEFFFNELYAFDKSSTLYRMLWQNITPYLTDIKTIYYSPTGQLFNLNFDVLCDLEGNVFGDKYSMIRVTSTANIADVKSATQSPIQSSVLYGNIKYDESIIDMADASSSYNSFSGTSIHSELTLRSENERGKWGPIPSTKKEIDEIGTLLKGHGINVSVYEGNAANEESFKALSGKSPDILHLATHGFVIDTQQKAIDNKFVASTSVYSQKDSYMMWAGLMLAGGNNIWQGRFNLSNVEDGILTADEISRLNLSKTKLVVLSACETARGKIDPVDGVYGLQRAFKMAGAQTIVMSLWKVQDDATSMLMTQFYTYLTNGVEKHKALWKAMMEVREKYKDPYYWAGFIMLD